MSSLMKQNKQPVNNSGIGAPLLANSALLQQLYLSNLLNAAAAANSTSPTRNTEKLPNPSSKLESSD